MTKSKQKKEYRCPKCGKLIFIYKGDFERIEVKCPRCKTYSVARRPPEES